MVLRALVLTVLLGVASAEEQDDIAGLIRKLGSHSLEERDAATADLLKRGESAFDAVEAATRDTDSEIAGRARDIHAALAKRPDCLLRAIRALRVRHKTATNELLLGAWTTVHEALVGRSWGEVAAVLGRDKVKCTEYHGLSGLSILEVTPPRPAGEAFDVELTLLAGRKTSVTKETVLRIAEAQVVLKAAFHAPHAEVLARDPFPAQSLFGRALGSANALRAAREYPVLAWIHIQRHIQRDSTTSPPTPVAQVWLRFETEDRYQGISLFGCPEGDALDFERTQGSTNVEARSWSLKRKGFSPPPPDPASPCVAFSAADLRALPDTIERLELVGESLKPPDMAVLARFKRLRTLDLSATGLTSQALKELPALERIEAMALSPRMADATLEEAARHPRLRLLRISGATDATATNLSAIKTLQTLELNKCPRLTDAGLAHLAKLPELRALQLDGADVTAEGISALARGGLEHLSLRGMKQGGDLFKSAVQIGSLRRLLVHDLAGLTDEHIAVIAWPPKLDELTFTSCIHLTDRGVETARGTLKNFQGGRFKP